jgi:hypothetical protein
MNKGGLQDKASSMPQSCLEKKMCAINTLTERYESMRRGNVKNFDKETLNGRSQYRDGAAPPLVALFRISARQNSSPSHSGCGPGSGWI